MQVYIGDRIKLNISQYGQHVVCVASSDDDPPEFQDFVYTIGNHEVGLPELLPIGDSSATFGQIVNVLGSLQRNRGIPFCHGEIVDFTAALPARIIDAGKKGREEYAVQVGVYYETEIFEVMQVLLPDPTGLYPGDAGCPQPYSNQPILASAH